MLGDIRYYCVVSDNRVFSCQVSDNRVVPVWDGGQVFLYRVSAIIVYFMRLIRGLFEVCVFVETVKYLYGMFVETCYINLCDIVTHRNTQWEYSIGYEYNRLCL